MAKLTQKEVEDRLLAIAPHLVLADTYIGQNTPCRFYDSKVGDYFYAKPKNIFRGHTTGHPSLSRIKQEETNQKRYGAKCSLQNKEVQNKIKDTLLDRYGVENASQNVDIKRRKQDTCRENYGVLNPMQSIEVRDKHKERYKSKTGFENPFSNPECMQKAEETSLLKFGTKHPMQSEIVQQKRKKTHQAKWGCQFPSQHPETREKQLVTLAASMRNGSKPELEMLSWIHSLGIEAKKSYLGGDHPCEIDIMCESMGIGIEFNGDYWHSEVNVPNDYHYEKTQKAIKNGVELIHIFQSEWQTNKEIVKSYIKAKLGKCERRIFARKCEIIEVSKETSFKFFNENHLQGKPHLHIKTFGLVYQGEIVAAASFSKPHRQNIKQIQLSRFANVKDCLVVGGLSKLCKHAYKNLGEFVSFVHLRLGYGNAYYKAGFTYVGTVRYDYWYWDSSKKKIVTKQARKKSTVKTPEGVTEHEHALQDGLLRIYDCGKLKFIYRDATHLKAV
jgi:flagellar hook protein FlgE